MKKEDYDGIETQVVRGIFFLSNVIIDNLIHISLKGFNAAKFRSTYPLAEGLTASNQHLAKYQHMGR